MATNKAYPTPRVRMTNFDEESESDFLGDSVVRA